MSGKILRWREVTAPEDVNGNLRPLLDTVDALRRAWKAYLGQVSPEEFAEARRRTLRRHAIETGIIERLYDVDWGVTKALVAEGLTLDVAAREGGIDENVLATINAQFEALEGLAEAAREGRDLSVSFIRQLHQLITRQQHTYTAVNQFGQAIEARLRHGQGKTEHNYLYRQDGTVLEHVPPEQVQPQIERLIELYHRETSGLHPIVTAAWLHHGFTCIHPFQDGNGRVARALTLLVLLRQDYAPLVVDRNRRNDYLTALDAANEGDLAPLVRLFAELEIIALRSELERPVRLPAAGAVSTARAYAERLRDLRQGKAEELAAASAALARAVSSRTSQYLEELARGVQAEFASIDPNSWYRMYSAAPPDPRAKWWFKQLVRVARELDFYANLSEGSWWSRLHLTVLGSTLRYVVATQKVGHGETGVLAVTVFAELRPEPQGQLADEAPAEEPATWEPVLRCSSDDSVTLVHTDDPEVRWPEVAALIDRTLAAAVASFAGRLG